ncbi:MAG: teichoic acid transport system ATP-binding protein [Thermoleophilaceae bacterium]|nr:teichoic acid transport system ATP-binding protein [Thermoleophilaceae bacterium]
MSLPSVSDTRAGAAGPAAASSNGAGPPAAIKVEDVSVTYRTSLEKKPTFKGTLIRMGRRERSVREIEAVKNVTLEIRRGSVVGILGANGAGKSTLVRTMAGILPPTVGRVEVQGRVSTLLALGVGFEKDLTGRQNVKLGGLAAGLTRAQLDEKYEDIVEFAELEDFMDMPMRTYSSGMYGRLGFSVAVNMEPDILLIDEALSVGDARFRKKSAAKMRELCGGGRTIVLVSHALGTINDLCDAAVWMHKGELQMNGEPQAVIDAYTQFLEVGEDALTMEDM